MPKHLIVSNCWKVNTYSFTSYIFSINLFFNFLIYLISISVFSWPLGNMSSTDSVLFIVVRQVLRFAKLQIVFFLHVQSFLLVFEGFPLRRIYNFGLFYHSSLIKRWYFITCYSYFSIHLMAILLYCCFSINIA